MSTLSKHLFAALMGAAVLSSCSRPVAYFQASQREHFATPKTETVVVVTPTEAAQPVATVEVPTPDAAPAAPAEQLAQTKQVIGQLDAYVRNDSKLASNKKLTKRMARVNELLAMVNTKTAVSTQATSTKKMGLMERLVLKKMNKKIHRTLVPEETKVASNTKLGAIIGVVGLLFILIGAVAGSGVVVLLGLIGLIVGLVLLLIGLANT